jgi:hypothetical protein
MLSNYIKKYYLEKDDFLFNCTRQTSRKYGKMATTLAELNIFEQQDEKSIDGFWNHLLRKCRAKQMRKDGADEELVMLKLRHSFSMLHFDIQNLTSIISKHGNQKNIPWWKH